MQQAVSTRVRKYAVKPSRVASLLPICLYTLGFLVAKSEISLAQVTTDNTVNTTVNQNGNVAEITGGETRGSNLFHSFQDFSVPTGNEAFFNNPSDVANIFSRVTGGNISSIDGVIRANGNASLFLINPAGIIFGEGSRLDIGGSFYGSTASNILFEDGEFSAVDLDSVVLPVRSFQEQREMQAVSALPLVISI
ncbi:MAG: filamentous hemagglutinin N-terminal domain-containing protein [Pleurocapsa sp. MO_226.B13]|nr:filamentous hemagglutinin N-terminal domain-containing protein [Pleurocapsa sp. MO_226.B13]